MNQRSHRFLKSVYPLILCLLAGIACTRVKETRIDLPNGGKLINEIIKTQTLADYFQKKFTIIRDGDEDYGPHYVSHFYYTPPEGGEVEIIGQSDTSDTIDRAICIDASANLDKNLLRTARTMVFVTKSLIVVRPKRGLLERIYVRRGSSVWKEYNFDEKARTHPLWTRDQAIIEQGAQRYQTMQRIDLDKLEFVVSHDCMRLSRALTFKLSEHGESLELIRLERMTEYSGNVFF
ncbi:MAG: hypothetical protein ACREOO_22625 [bacterium]